MLALQQEARYTDEERHVEAIDEISRKYVIYGSRDEMPGENQQDEYAFNSIDSRPSCDGRVRSAMSIQ